MSPDFLSLAEVLEIHRDQIERYGGETGIRDLGLLQSALAMPAAGFGGRFLHEDLFEMAAAYLFHIIRNHPFVDGNKRTGTVAALVFLIVNGIGVDADEDALEKTIIAVAEGKLNKRLSPISSESIHARSNTIRKIPADNAPTESDESEREPQRALHFSSFRHI